MTSPYLSTTFSSSSSSLLLPSCRIFRSCCNFFNVDTLSSMNSSNGAGIGLARIVNDTTFCVLTPLIVPRDALGVFVGAISQNKKSVNSCTPLHTGTYVPGALTAVSLNGTIGFDAWTSTLANRSRRSFKHRCSPTSNTREYPRLY